MIGRSVMLAFSIAAAQPAAKPTPTPVAKPTPPATTFNCLFTSSVFYVRETDQQKKELAHEVLLFYLGKLDPRISVSQLSSAMKQTADGLNGVTAAPLMNECLVEFRAKASMLETAIRQSQQRK